MGKKNKKIKIPKNRDIEEVVEEFEEKKEQEEDITNKEELSNRTLEDEIRYKLFLERRERFEKEEEERERLLRAMAKIEELESRKEDPEIEEYFAEVKAKTEAIMKEQEEQRRKSSRTGIIKKVEEREPKRTQTEKAQYKGIVDEQLLEDIRMLDEKDDLRSRYRFYPKAKKSGERLEDRDKRRKRVLGESKKMWDDSRDEK